MAKGLNGQLKYAEELLNKPFTQREKDLFEWAYTQGYEDSQEGVKREILHREKETNVR